MTASFVVCLDAETGETRWVRYLGEATAAFDNMMGMPFIGDISGRLLSLDGATLYYQTNMGAVAALDADTGAIRWLATYPHMELRGAGQGLGRELNPAVVHDGLVIVAPDDAPSIYAFDAATGRLAWRTEPLPKVIHLLGVAQGHLIATGDRAWLIDVSNGKVIRYWPEGASGMDSYGRGLLAGDSIYWPTRTEIHVLSQATGLPTDRSPIALKDAFGTTGGNLAVGDGYLVIAQSDALIVFCAE